MLVVKCPFGIWKVPFSAMTKTMPSSSHSQSRIADGLLAAGCRSVLSPPLTTVRVSLLMIRWKEHGYHPPGEFWRQAVDLRSGSFDVVEHSRCLGKATTGPRFLPRHVPSQALAEL